jgi:hypothetical protein
MLQGIGHAMNDILSSAPLCLMLRVHRHALGNRLEVLAISNNTES